ncbi:unnamed protein product, partial [Staurois parvus]
HFCSSVIILCSFKTITLSFSKAACIFLVVTYGFPFVSRTFLLAVVAAIFLAPPDLGLVSRDPQTFHFLIGDLTVLIGIFKALDIFLCPFPSL